MWLMAPLKTRPWRGLENAKKHAKTRQNTPKWGTPKLRVRQFCRINVPRRLAQLGCHCLLNIAFLAFTLGRIPEGLRFLERQQRLKTRQRTSPKSLADTGTSPAAAGGDSNRPPLLRLSLPSVPTRIAVLIVRRRHAKFGTVSGKQADSQTAAWPYAGRQRVDPLLTRFAVWEPGRRRCGNCEGGRRGACRIGRSGR